MENTKTKEHIELYPGNWLYNAGVVGFLQSLKMFEDKNVSNYLKSDGKVIFSKKIFEDLKTQERYFSDKKIASIYRNAFFRNFLNTKDDVEGFPEYVKTLSQISNAGQKCGICNSNHQLSSEQISNLKQIGLEKFLARIADFNIVYSKEIAPSRNEFPNAFWELNNSLSICPICSFILLHHQMPFAKIIDNSNLFIHAPSFKLMYELNTLLERLVSKENTSYKNLLAMSIIEFSSKTNVMLNKWASMNIEIIAIKRTREKTDIEFINLPYNTIRLISNRQIAELLSNISEFRVINMVINNGLEELIELGYRLLKLSTKQLNAADNKFLSDNLFLYKNRKDNVAIRLTANKLFKLYALIEQRLKNK